MSKMRTYVIRQGDYLAQLAHRLGFNADDVWNDPANAELKKRRDPNLLYPGEVLYVPAASRAPAPITSKVANDYVATVPKTTVRLTFEDADGPLANEPYVVEGVGPFAEKTTDGGGVVVLELPVHVHELRVVFPERGIAYPVKVGDMDPIDEAIGVRKRLRNLGYGGDMNTDEAAGLSDESRAAGDQMAILAFQKSNGLEVTGELDEATRAALEGTHE
jgi:hypothetical protein